MKKYLIWLVFAAVSFAQNNLHDFAPSLMPQGGLYINVDSGLATVSNVPTAIAAAQVSLAANKTTYVYVDLSAGTLATNTTGFSTSQFPIAKVVTNAKQVVTLTDSRAYASTGTGGSGSGTVTAVTGMSNQIDVATGTTTPALTISSTFIAPGTLSAVTSIDATKLSGNLPSLHVPTGNTLTIDSGGTLTCAGGSTCPTGTLSASGTPANHQAAIWASTTTLKGFSTATIDDSGNAAFASIASTGVVSGTIEDKGGQVYNALQYGLVGNGTTDNSTALGSLITTVCASTSTRTIFFPIGQYYIATGISIPSTCKNLTLRGQNGWPGGGSVILSEIISDQAIALLTFGDASNTNTNGPTISGLGFRDSSGSTNQVVAAIKLLRTNGFRLEQVAISSLNAGVGILMDGTGDYTQFGVIDQPEIRGTHIGIQALAKTSGIQILGGTISGLGTVADATGIGLDIEGRSDTINPTDTAINQYATGVKIYNSDQSQIRARLEMTGTSFNTGIGILVDGSAPAGAGAGSYGNGIVSATVEAFATGIKVTANAKYTTISANEYRNSTVVVSDAGVLTFRCDSLSCPVASTPASSPKVATILPVAGGTNNGSSIVKVQSTSSLIVAGNGTLAFGNNNTAGNLLIAVVRVAAGNSSAPTDTLGNSYSTAINNQTLGSASNTISVYYLCNSAPGANTVAFTSTGTGLRAAIFEYSGIVASSCIDQTHTDSQSSTTPASGATATTATALELAFGAMGSLDGATTATAGSGWTLEEVVNTGQSMFVTEDQVLTSTGTPNATFSSIVAGVWGAAIVTFKGAAISCPTCVTYSSPATGIARSTSGSQAIAGSELSGDVSTSGSNATVLAAPYKTYSCEIFTFGTGTSNVVQSTDAPLTGSCYNVKGVTETITDILCEADAGTPTVNPTFGAAGTGTTILGGALTCGAGTWASAVGNSIAISNPSLLSTNNVLMGIGGTLTSSHEIHIVIKYTVPAS